MMMMMMMIILGFFRIASALPWRRRDAATLLLIARNETVLSYHAL